MSLESYQGFAKDLLSSYSFNGYRAMPHFA